MSGEFLKHMDDWVELRPRGQTMIFAGKLCEYWPEIRALVEAAWKLREATYPNHMDGSGLDRALDALDKKAEPSLPPGSESTWIRELRRLDEDREQKRSCPRCGSVITNPDAAICSACMDCDIARARAAGGV